jgi:phenylacetic acid degradation protein
LLEVYSIDGMVPVVHPSAFVHPSAVLIGDVIIGPHCYIGPLASLRGDFGRIIVEQGANVQDGCILHGFFDTDTVVEADGHIGHGAVLHGCRIGKDALVGMNAVIMDNASIGACSIVGAAAFVKANFVAPPRSLVIGTPATVARSLRDEEIEWKRQGTRDYHQLTIRSINTMQRVAPLGEVEPGRPRMPGSSGSKPKGA